MAHRKTTQPNDQTSVPKLYGTLVIISGDLYSNAPYGPEAVDRVEDKRVADEKFDSF